MSRFPAPFIFVESNTSGTGRLFVRAARAMGFAPCLITACPDRYDYVEAEPGLEVVVVPAIDEDAIAAFVRSRQALGRPCAGITSSSDYFIATAAAVATRVGLPGPSPRQVRLARDKSWQRDVLAGAGLPVPMFRVVRSASEASRAARAIGLPVVIKPVDGSGSVGVRVCHHETHVDRHATALLEQPAAHQALLVESLVEGPEFSVEVFDGRAIGITRKHLGRLPHFVETGHDYPAVVSQSVAHALTATVERASALMGLTWGPLHWELRVRQGQAIAIEVNPRLAGGFIPELVRLASGVDLIRETLRRASGRPPRIRPRRAAFAAIRFLVAPASGRLHSLGGLAAARGLPGVADVALYRRPGEWVTIRGDFRDRIGHVIAHGPDAATAAATAERGRRLVAVRIDRSTVVDARIAS